MTEVPPILPRQACGDEQALPSGDVELVGHAHHQL